MRRSRLFALMMVLAAAAQPSISGQQGLNLGTALRWRSIGPYRGGRVKGGPGTAAQRLVYYMGATGGGVWKTDDAGTVWTNVSDGFFKSGSVGAVSVSQ